METDTKRLQDKALELDGIAKNREADLAETSQAYEAAYNDLLRSKYELSLLSQQKLDAMREYDLLLTEQKQLQRRSESELEKHRILMRQLYKYEAKSRQTDS